MDQRIEAVFENGIFRPNVPVELGDGQRVSLLVKAEALPVDDVSDVRDLIDVDFVAECRRRAGLAPSVEESRKLLSAFDGSLADRIVEERDER